MALENLAPSQAVATFLSAEPVSRTPPSLDAKDASHHQEHTNHLHTKAKQAHPRGVEQAASGSESIIQAGTGIMSQVRPPPPPLRSACGSALGLGYFGRLWQENLSQDSSQHYGLQRSVAFGTRALGFAVRDCT